MNSALPAAYSEGLAKARLLDAALAGKYVSHTQIGDPEADSLIELIDRAQNPRSQEWIQRGIEGGPAAIQDAPGEVREFFASIEPVPDWFDASRARLGCRAFHRHSEMFIGAFVGAVLIEGFSTLISKSFSITGRLVDQGVRRLKQNNRHLIEIFLPGGLDRNADGWKLSVRIRLVHAKVRFLLRKSEDWDGAAWGVPISAAHVALATAVFSALLLKRARMLGVILSKEERESFMSIWRYTGHLMGVVPELLFEDETSALRLIDIGTICEPPPSDESILLANGLVNSAPIVAGIDQPAERRKLAAKIYQISRALIGDALADQLHFPKTRTRGVLAWLRWTNRLDRLAQRIVPALAKRSRASQFQKLLEVSLYPDEGLRYRMPGHVHAERDRPL